MIDFDKPVKTVGGYEVRILCTDAPGEYPVVGYVNYKTYVYPQQWRKDGTVSTITDKHTYDLVNVKQKREGWINIFKDFGVISTGTVYTSKKAAKSAAASYCNSYIATVKIEWEE